MADTSRERELAARLEDAVDVISGITVVERGCETDTIGCDVILITILPVEDVLSFEGPKITGFVVLAAVS